MKKNRAKIERDIPVVEGGEWEISPSLVQEAKLLTSSKEPSSILSLCLSLVLLFTDVAFAFRFPGALG